MSTNFDFPIGTILAMAVNSIPPNWLLCDGSPIDSKYQELKTALGSDNVPNLCGRTLIGTGTTYSIGHSDGEETHQLTIAEMPSHDHGGDANVSSTFFFGSQVDNDCGGGESGWCIIGNQDVTASNMRGLELSSKIYQNGSDAPHNNMQPYYVVNYIIYAGEPN